MASDLEAEKERLNEALWQIQAAVDKNDLHKEQEMGPFAADIVVMQANKLSETKEEALEDAKGEEVEGICGSISGNKEGIGKYKEEGVRATAGYARGINEGARIMPFLNVGEEKGRSVKKEGFLIRESCLLCRFKILMVCNRNICVIGSPKK
jgi:hypothetical protein